MARYFFHIFNDLVVKDYEGAECASVDAALAIAQRSARHLAADSILHYGHLVLHHRIEIENEAGERVGTVEFRDAVEIRD